MTRVLALHKKAAELERKGHMLRAAEYFGRAAEAACSLDPGADNLVTLSMLRYQASSLFNHFAETINSNPAADSGALSAHRAELIALLTAITAALERRHVSGTLLEGKCTAAEEAWYATRLQDDGHSPSYAADMQMLVGFKVCISTAHYAMDVLVNAHRFAAECSATQLEMFAQFVVRAMDLMQLPRRHAKSGVADEFLLGRKLSTLVPDLGSAGLDPRLVQLITDAWQRLQQSGVLVERGLLDERVFQKVDAYTARHSLATNSAMSAPGLRSCGLASCSAREAHPAHFKSCAACRTVVYCCRKHQVADWAAHKAACKEAARKTAEAEKGAGAHAQAGT